MADTTDTEEALERALDALEGAWQAAVAAIRATTDPRKRFRAATKLSSKVIDMPEGAADLRGQAAREIRDDEALSLAKLADFLGVSAQRAHQMVSKAKREETQG